MKKTLALFLVCAMCLSVFAGCTANEAPVETNTPAPTEETKDYSQYAGIVADPKGWYEELMALPIANNDMTEDELRQLCVDAFRLNLSFQWTPTEDIAFGFTILDKSYEVTLNKGIAYSGLFYNNNTAHGHAYKVLDFYDPETGAMDIEAMGGYKMNILGSACARGITWAWSRVCNTSCPEDTVSMHQYASGVVPVGPYNYPPTKYSFSPGDGTKLLIADNGLQTIYESYAATKPADGVYSSSSYHVMMISKNPEVTRWPDGSIDPANSFAYVNEQAAGGTLTENYNYTQSNGVTLRPLGTVDRKVSFEELATKGYVPFALKELLKQEPIEPGETWISKGDTRMENGQDISLAEILASYKLNANYAIVTFEFQIKDQNGNLLYEYDPRFNTNSRTYDIPLNNLDIVEQFRPYANGKNTIHINARLSNGEFLEAVNTLLKIA